MKALWTRLISLLKPQPVGRGDVTRLSGQYLGFDGIELTSPIREAIATRSYERKERKLIRQCIRPDDRVLELGGGLGVVTTVIASRLEEGMLVSVEADDRLIPIIEKNLRRNGYSGTVLHGAVLARRDMPDAPLIDFFVLPDFWGSSLHQPDPPTPFEITQTPVHCLEDLLKKHAITVIVMDIEGAELDLLSNGDFNGVREILVEFHQKPRSPERQNVLSRMQSLGFKVDRKAVSGPVKRLVRQS